MEAELEKLRQKIAMIRHQLELLEMQRLEVSGEVGNAELHSPEHEQGQLLELSLRIQDDALEAELLAAHIAMSQVMVSAEVERVRALQPSPSVKELAELRERCEQVRKDHRLAAKREYELATDSDLACDRLNGDAPKPEVELTEQQKREKQQEQEYDFGISR